MHVQHIYLWIKNIDYYKAGCWLNSYNNCRASKLGRRLHVRIQIQRRWSKLQTLVQRIHKRRGHADWWHSHASLFRPYCSSRKLFTLIVNVWLSPWIRRFLVQLHFNRNRVLICKSDDSKRINVLQLRVQTSDSNVGHHNRQHCRRRDLYCLRVCLLLHRPEKRNQKGWWC